MAKLCPRGKAAAKRKFKVSSKKVPFGGKEHTNYLQKQIRDKREPMKNGGRSFPDLTGDGKVTQADILKGRGVFKKGGSTTFKDLKKKGVISDKVKVKEFNKLKKQFGGGKK